MSEYDNYLFWYRSLTKSQRDKARRNPVPTADSRCSICGAGWAETHEIFEGNGRRLISIHYGLQRKLCSWKHRYIHDHPESTEAIELKKEGQRQFEENYSREDFIKLFGQDYLWEE